MSTHLYPHLRTAKRDQLIRERAAAVSEVTKLRQQVSDIEDALDEDPSSDEVNIDGTTVDRDEAVEVLDKLERAGRTTAGRVAKLDIAVSDEQTRELNRQRAAARSERETRRMKPVKASLRTRVGMHFERKRARRALR